MSGKARNETCEPIWEIDWPAQSFKKSVLRHRFVSVEGMTDSTSHLHGGHQTPCLTSYLTYPRR